MALHTSGAISLSQVNVELKLSATATISLNDAAVRKLLERPSGTISLYDAYGKSDGITYVNNTARTSVSIYEIMGSPTAVGNYIFENNAEINASNHSYALRTGIFPAGSTLTIVNNSYIRGQGGAGSSSIFGAGGAGGNAIWLDMPCRIDNTNGYILAGGGGGGTAERRATGNSTYYISAGGGSGAGKPVGLAGGNMYNLSNTTYGVIETNSAPKFGTAEAGGAGGMIKEGYYKEYAYGGAGGANGVAGALGSTTYEGTSSYKNTQNLSVAGTAGAAVFTSGKTLTQIAGFNTTRVKGAIV